jgi:hypothetical protein
MARALLMETMLDDVQMHHFGTPVLMYSAEVLNVR